MTAGRVGFIDWEGLIAIRTRNSSMKQEDGRPVGIRTIQE